MPKGAFKKMVKHIEGEGYNKDAAGAISASIAKKKYGKSAVQKAAAEHKPLKASQALKKPKKVVKKK